MEEDSTGNMIMGISEEGCHEGKMRRGMKKMNEALQVDMAEVFSPPRVTQEGKNWGLKTRGGGGLVHRMGFK